MADAGTARHIKETNKTEPINVPMTRAALARLIERIPIDHRITADLGGFQNTVLWTIHGLQVRFLVNEEAEPCLH